MTEAIIGFFSNEECVDKLALLSSNTDTVHSSEIFGRWSPKMTLNLRDMMVLDPLTDHIPSDIHFVGAVYMIPNRQTSVWSVHDGFDDADDELRESVNEWIRSPEIKCIIIFPVDHQEIAQAMHDNVQRNIPWMTKPDEDFYSSSDSSDDELAPPPEFWQSLQNMYSSVLSPLPLRVPPRSPLIDNETNDTSQHAAAASGSGILQGGFYPRNEVRRRRSESDAYCPCKRRS